MTASEMLKAYPTSTITALVNPYDKTVRFVREDEWGQYPCEAPRDFTSEREWAHLGEYKVAA